MLAPSMMPIMSVYSIEETEIGTPHLHALVRYRHEGLKLAESTAVYKNYILREGYKGKKGSENHTEGDKRIKIMGEHIGRGQGHKTAVKEITEAYEYVAKMGEPIGKYTKEDFVREEYEEDE